MHTAPAPATIPDESLSAETMPGMIGKYRVLQRLGDGATSEVFLCHDDFNNRRVAIKRVRMLPQGDPMGGRFSERFFAAEAALVGRLQHPNVVQILDAVPDPHLPYLVMEYVQGGTVREFCSPNHLLPLEQVALKQNKKTKNKKTK